MPPATHAPARPATRPTGFTSRRRDAHEARLRDAPEASKPTRARDAHEASKPAPAPPKPVTPAPPRQGALDTSRVGDNWARDKRQDRENSAPQLDRAIPAGERAKVRESQQVAQQRLSKIKNSQTRASAQREYWKTQQYRVDGEGKVFRVNIDSRSGEVAFRRLGAAATDAKGRPAKIDQAVLIHPKGSQRDILAQRVELERDGHQQIVQETRSTVRGKVYHRQVTTDTRVFGANGDQRRTQTIRAEQADGKLKFASRDQTKQVGGVTERTQAHDRYDKSGGQIFAFRSKGRYAEGLSVRTQVRTDLVDGKVVRESGREYVRTKGVQDGVTQIVEQSRRTERFAGGRPLAASDVARVEVDRRTKTEDPKGGLGEGLILSTQVHGTGRGDKISWGKLEQRSIERGTDDDFIAETRTFTADPSGYQREGDEGVRVYRNDGRDFMERHEGTIRKVGMGLSIAGGILMFTPLAPIGGVLMAGGAGIALSYDLPNALENPTSKGAWAAVGLDAIGALGGAGALAGGVAAGSRGALIATSAGHSGRINSLIVNSSAAGRINASAKSLLQGRTSILQGADRFQAAAGTVLGNGVVMAGGAGALVYQSQANIRQGNWGSLAMDVAMSAAGARGGIAARRATGQDLSRGQKLLTGTGGALGFDVQRFARSGRLRPGQEKGRVDPKLLERMGDPVEVETNRRREIPYGIANGYEVHRISPGKKLDLDSLAPNTKYIWVVDKHGTFHVAPEGQAGFGRTGERPQGRDLKHGDLVPAPGGQRRGPARAGGELYAAADSPGQWILTNHSSYSFKRGSWGNEARQDEAALAKALGLESGFVHEGVGPNVAPGFKQAPHATDDSLIAVADLLHAGGADTSRIKLINFNNVSVTRAGRERSLMKAGDTPIQALAKIRAHAGADRTSKSYGMYSQGDGPVRSGPGLPAKWYVEYRDPTGIVGLYNTAPDGHGGHKTIRSVTTVDSLASGNPNLLKDTVLQVDGDDGWTVAVAGRRELTLRKAGETKRRSLEKVLVENRGRLLGRAPTPDQIRIARRYQTSGRIDEPIADGFAMPSGLSQGRRGMPGQRPVEYLVLDATRDPWLKATAERADRLVGRMRKGGADDLAVARALATLTHKATTRGGKDEIVVLDESPLLGDASRVAKAMCRHKAALFHYLGSRAGLSSSVVGGEAWVPVRNQWSAHAWNEVRAADGRTAVIDVNFPQRTDGDFVHVRGSDDAQDALIGVAYRGGTEARVYGQLARAGVDSAPLTYTPHVVKHNFIERTPAKSKQPVGEAPRKEVSGRPTDKAAQIALARSIETKHADNGAHERVGIDPETNRVVIFDANGRGTALEGKYHGHVPSVVPLHAANVLVKAGLAKMVNGQLKLLKPYPLH